MGQADRAFTRRIGEEFVETAEGSQVRLEQVRDFELRDKVAGGGISAARATSSSLPSKPMTSAPRRAIGKEKSPMPQKRSAIRSPGRGSSRCRARDTSSRLVARFTCAIRRTAG